MFHRGISGTFLGAYVIQAQKLAVIDPGPAATVGNFLSGLAELGTEPVKNCEYIWPLTYTWTTPVDWESYKTNAHGKDHRP
jgi:hypothetical protein